MKTAAELKSFLLAALGANADPQLRSLDFSRPPKSVTYSRATGTSKQVLVADLTIRPSVATRRGGYVYPYVALHHAATKRAAKALVGSEGLLELGSEGPSVFAFHLLRLEPIGRDHGWEFETMAECNEVVNRFVDLVRGRSADLLERTRSIEAFMLAAEHLEPNYLNGSVDLCISAAYWLRGDRKSAERWFMKAELAPKVERHCRRALQTAPPAMQ